MAILRTERLTLRPIALSDVSAITAHLSNWNVSRRLSRVPYPYVLADCEAWIPTAIEHNRSGVALIYGIHADRLIGCISVEQLNETPVLGYWLAQSSWGQGYGTEAAAAVLRQAFQRHGINKVRALAHIENEASLRLQKKLGFEVTGTKAAFSLSRNCDVESIETILSRAAFEKSEYMQPNSALTND